MSKNTMPKFSLLYAVLLLSLSAFAAVPQIGYVYPAGACRGDTITAVFGGQALWSVSEVLSNSEDVQAEFIDKANHRSPRSRRVYIPLVRARQNGKSDEHIQKLRKEMLKKEGRKEGDWYINRIEKMSKKEFQHFNNAAVRLNRLQRTNQIDQKVIAKIKVSKDAAPGRYELRLRGRNGITNPVVFMVGVNKEFREYEPNTREPRKEDVLQHPAVINGQITPGDVDKFYFKANKGEKLVIKTQARELVPYLADSVPGWFQAVVSVKDHTGREAAFCDDFRNQPDPVILFDVPRTDRYTLEIRDAVFRGREDFVYRVSIDKSPFVESVFPLGAKKGEKVRAKLEGWNLPAKSAALNTGGESGVKRDLLKKGSLVSNQFKYFVSELPEMIEKENPKNRPQPVKLPLAVNGRIAAEGDVDAFSFDARKGRTYVFEVWAARLNSPLDSFLRIKNKAGKILAFNDDSEKTRTGMITHFADSYLIYKAGKSEKLTVELSDTQGKGSKNHCYRLRMSEPMPDFKVFTDRSCTKHHLGDYQMLKFCALRKDGFDGAIEISVKNKKTGYSLEGAVIPEGESCIFATLNAPAKPAQRLSNLEFTAYASAGGSRITREVCPADDTTQAFVLHHLVPAEGFLADLNGKGKREFPVSVDSQQPVKIVQGRGAAVNIKTAGHLRGKYGSIILSIKEGPEAIDYANITPRKNGYSIKLRAREGLKAGDKGNIIFEAKARIKPRKKGGKVNTWNLGCMPAIRYEVVSGA
ncbi:hypothetical protein L21SP3_00814 [Sedimentisphaera cyanobacteriorum]|uniref:Subtilase-type serine protease n=1 Tax=Sedimentisphaera cyanobacteriorum TaxID=1940790 RepID=A0A1Q2HNI9_9BACT|nr:hypothetical protein [Sedimentisphaera cyanobacteriorum]AQQ09017.1 hypothetical protein L21SP3_00814 [Sedimentisphaera cyanobacteriorum]